MPAINQLDFGRMRLVTVFCLALLASACASIQNAPSNQPLRGESNDARATALTASRQANDTAVGLSLSGGGLRAAAFSLGVLQGLETARDRNGRTLFDDLILITSVSGGSMTAAYFGLHGKEALT